MNKELWRGIKLIISALILLTCAILLRLNGNLIDNFGKFLILIFIGAIALVILVKEWK